MTSDKLKQQKGLSLIYSISRECIFFSVLLAGGLSQLGVPAWVMLHTVISGHYVGQMELIMEPEGGIRLKMDNRQGSLPSLKKHQTEQP